MDKGAEAGPARPWWVIVLIGRRPRRTLARLAVLVTGTFLVFRFLLVVVRIDGKSMEPTCRDQRLGLCLRPAFAFREPGRGDIVLIRPDAGSSAGYYLKRVIALPGEEIAFHAGQLWINGQLVPEPYLKRRYAWEMPPKTVEPGRYYVVGDNRVMDQRDHYQGQVRRGSIVGRFLL